MATTPNPAITLTPAQIAEQVKAMNVQAMNSAANTAMSPQANKGGSVAQMQQQAQTPAETIAKAQAQPGVMQLGATTGATPGGQLPVAPTQFQAVTGAGATMDAASLKQMKETEARNEASRVAEANRLKQSSASGTTSYYDAASGTWKQGSSPETQKIQAEMAATTPMWDAEAGTWKTGTATVGTAGATGAGADMYSDDPRMKLLAEQQKRIDDQLNYQQQYIKQQFDAKIQSLAAQQKSESGQSAMQLARMGAFGQSSSGIAYMQTLDTQHAAQINQLESERQNAIMQAQDAANKQMMDLAWKKVEELDKIDDNFRKANQDKLDNVLKYAQIKKYEKDDWLNTAQGMVEDGKAFEDLPKDYIESQYPEMDTTTAKSLFTIAQSSYKSKQTENALKNTQLKNATVEAAMNVAKFLDPSETLKIPYGDKEITVSAKNFQDTKQYQINTYNDQGKAISQIVTTDKNGKEIARTTVGDYFVAPHYDTDAGEWVTFAGNSTSPTPTVLQNNGKYGEGVTAMKDSANIVASLEKKFGKPTQEPGGAFSHKNVTGYDFAVKENTPLQSPVNGIVYKVGKDDIYGNYVDVQDAENGYIVRMAHMNKANVKQGDSVTEETQLGLSGNTGLSTAPHTHVEFRTSDDHAIQPGSSLDNTKAVIASEATGDTVDATDISKFEADTGNAFNPKSRSDQKAFASWKITKEKQRIADEDQLRKETNTAREKFYSNPETRNYITGMGSMNVVEEAARNAAMDPNMGGVSDLAILTSYAKSLDPATGVRDAEFSNMSSATGELQRLSMLDKKFVKGDRLTPEGRQHFVDAAKNQMDARENNFFDFIVDPIMKGSNYNYKEILPENVIQRYIAKRGVLLMGPDGSVVGVASENDPDYQKLLSNGYTIYDGTQPPVKGTVTEKMKTPNANLF